MTLLHQAITWVLENPGQFNRALGQHLLMSSLSILFALLIGLPLAVAILNRKGAAFVAVNSVNALRTLPSLAILAIMMPIMGIGLWPSIVALTVLALPPILINAYIGLRDVDPDALEAATGMGMSGSQILWRIRVPMAAPAMFAGLRTAAVQVLAGATLAPFIGGGGLGDFIAVGIAGMDMSRLLVGAIPIAILALAAEYLLALTERLLFSERTSAA
jgi:osmoprotectant transport system permease protein